MKVKTLKPVTLLFILPAILVADSCTSAYPEPEPVTKPIITSFDPGSGYGGNINTQVTITGQNFKESLNLNTVQFNGIPATVIQASPTQIITRVPAGAITGKISVTVDGHTGSAGTNFIVKVPETITSFTPTAGTAGTTVTITGTSFRTTLTNNIVLFNGHEAPVLSATPTTLVVKVPVGATTGRISVTIDNIDAVSAVDFTVL